jgi:hypothetical protein
MAGFMILIILDNLWQTRSGASSLKEKEKLLRAFSERMLTGVAAKFCKDSEQYQKAGGTKKSERRRPKRKTAKVAA